MILSIDGGKNIGWATFYRSGKFIEKGVIDHTEWFDPEACPLEIWKGDLFFWETNVDLLVVEGIRHDPNIQQGGSQRWESQIEGAVRMLGTLTGVEVVVQQPAILPVAAMHAGYEMPKTKTGRKKHLPDDISAWLHGRYYLTSIGVLS